MAAVSETSPSAAPTPDYQKPNPTMSFKSKSAYSLVPKPDGPPKTGDPELDEKIEFYQSQHAGIAPYFLGFSPHSPL
jgi:hypothetical protein